MTADVLQKLEDAFMHSYSDREACLYAGIAPSTLYNYQKENPAFMERKEALKLSPNLVAKRELVTGIKGNLDQARWWANHKMTDDFVAKSKVELEGKVQTEDVTVSEAEKRIADEYNQKLRDAIAAGHKKP
jgi:hypothetical protein